LSGELPDGRWVSAVRSALLDWYRRHGRDLPWRATRDPYAVWVSEVMLQQTRVEAVLPYYRRFLQRFPDVASLAAADEDEVLSVWTGLGYYRRARSLRAGALAVMEHHDGVVPEDPERLQALPGIGRYTAGAIASIAFDRPEPVVDGNVRRVLSRLLARDGKGDERFLWDVAGRLVEGPDPGDLNQALMELGATTCTPRNPGCLRCPVSSRCAGLAAGGPESFPSRRPRKRIEPVAVGVAVVNYGERILLERPGPDSPLRGTWDVPAVVLADEPAPDVAIAFMLRERHGLDVRVSPRAARVTHGILDRSLRLAIHTGRRLRGRVTTRPGLRWASREQMQRIPISGATPKVLRALNEA
jgi:A/G-specific adenine glycosylase